MTDEQQPKTAAQECGACGSDHIEHFAEAAVDWCAWCGAVIKDSWSAWRAPRGKK